MGLLRVARLAEIIADIQDAPDQEALRARVLSSIRGLGFDSFILSINAPDKHGLLAPELTSQGEDFFNDFDRYGFVEIDPVLEYSVSVERIFSWSSRRLQRDAEEKRLLDYLHSVPLARGLVIPLPRTRGRVSTINLTSSLEAKYNAETVDFVSIIVRVAMMRAESLGLSKFDAQARLVDADLSLRQIEVLNWAAQGKSNWDIAMITGQSKRAVDYHMSEILRKLKVTTRVQAIALTRGLCSPK